MPTLTFKVTDAEAAQYRAAAEESRVNFSTFARRAMRAAATPKKAARKTKDIIKPGFVALAGLPVTTEQVYAALYD